MASSEIAPPPPGDRAPPVEWQSVTHRFAVGGHKGYLIVAADGGRPVHLEIRMAKAGTLLRGLLDSLAASVCLGLERGVPLSSYVDTLAHARFEPSGWTKGELGYAHSIVDYVFRWLSLRYPRADALERPPVLPDGETCTVCGMAVTWPPDDPCPECGQIERKHAPPPPGDPGRPLGNAAAPG